MTMDSHTKGLKGSHIKVEKDTDSMIEEDDRDSWSRWTPMHEKKDKEARGRDKEWERDITTKRRTRRK
jgi:hypothetical protein